MTDAGQESLSTEGDKVVSVRGSWTVPLGMYNDVKEQPASEMETGISEKQVCDHTLESDKEPVVDVKETSGESLQHGEERGPSVVHDRVNEPGTVEENSRKRKTKESKEYEGKRLDDNDCERDHRHKNRRRSKSAENRRHHHKLREEPRVRHKRRRSRDSPSRVQSPKHSLEHNDDTLVGKDASSAARDETSVYTSNGRLVESISQSFFERKPDRKEWEEQEHSRKNNLKIDCRERLPTRDNERQYVRVDRCEETNHDLAHSKRKRSNSRDRSKETTHGDRGSRSDRRRPRHRTRSRSRGRYDRYKEAGSHQRRGRSRSRSRDNGRNRSKSLSRNNDAELRSKNVEKRLRSRSREREVTPVAELTSSNVDMQKQSGEEDGWRKKRSRSRSPSKHSYENYGSRDRENRLSQSGDRLKNWPDGERKTDLDFPKRRRSRSRSAERVWNSSDWEDRKHYRDEYSRDEFSRDEYSHDEYSRGDLPNSGSRSSRPERGSHGKYGRDRQNSWTRGEKEDNAILRDQSRENFLPNRWRGNQDHSGNRDRAWDRDRKRDYDDYRHRRADPEDQDVGNDNGQQLEDMVTKSLAKLRRDSDREHRGVDETLKDIKSSTDNKVRDKSQRWGETDRSAIPVLLSKNSAYKDNDAYDTPEAEDFIYDQACKEDFVHESNSHRLQPRDQQPGAPSQQGFPTPGKERHPPVGQPHFHGDFRQPPPPHVRVEFPPRGKALMQSPVRPGQFGIGARLMPGVVQVVTPIHLRPPPMAVDWRMMGPDAPGRGMFPISRPPPQVGPRGQLIQVGGFIRTQVPVEFLARHPLPLGHPSGPPFQTGTLPSHSLPPVHSGAPSQPSLLRPHPQSDPRQLPPPPPPITLLHSSHQLRLPNQEQPRGMVDMRHLGPPPVLVPPGLVPTHPPPNLAFPPPPLPIKLVGHGQGGHQSLAYTTSNQAVETLNAKSPSTPPPPPPPAVSSAPQDPRRYSIKLLSHKPVAAISSSTSDESLDSDSSSSPGPNESIAPPKPSVKQAWQQQSTSPERPNSALSFASDYTPQELTDDAYTEALFEEPYAVEERDVTSIRLEKAELNSQMEVSIVMPVPTPPPPPPSTGRANIVEDAEPADVCSQTALADEIAQIPEIVNPMASPTVTARLAGDKSPSNTGAIVAASASAAHSLQAMGVADLKKVLETVRTTTLEEEAKNQDKVRYGLV